MHIMSAIIKKKVRMYYWIKTEQQLQSQNFLVQRITCSPKLSPKTLHFHTILLLLSYPTSLQI